MAPWVDKTPGVVVRKIDIVSWESEAAEQATREFGVDAIPYTRVYDKTGKFLGAVQGSDFEAVRSLAVKGL